MVDTHDAALLKGKTLGKYELGVTLGKGSYAKVKLGIDKTDGSKYAIKIMKT